MRADLKNRTNKPFYPIDPLDLVNVTVKQLNDGEEWRLPNEFYLKNPAVRAHCTNFVILCCTFGALCARSLLFAL